MSAPHGSAQQFFEDHARNSIMCSVTLAAHAQFQQQIRRGQEGWEQQRRLDVGMLTKAQVAAYGFAGTGSAN